jgi:hypothetical protein
MCISAAGSRAYDFAKGDLHVALRRFVGWSRARYFWEAHMPRTLLMALAAALAVTTANVASAAPTMSGGAIKAAAEAVAPAQSAHYYGYGYGYGSYGYYYPRYYRHYYHRRFYRY